MVSRSNSTVGNYFGLGADFDLEGFTCPPDPPANSQVLYGFSGFENSSTLNDVTSLLRSISRSTSMDIPNPSSKKSSVSPVPSFEVFSCVNTDEGRKRIDEQLTNGRSLQNGFVNNGIISKVNSSVSPVTCFEEFKYGKANEGHGHPSSTNQTKNNTYNQHMKIDDGHDGPLTNLCSLQNGFVNNRITSKVNIPVEIKTSPLRPCHFFDFLLRPFVYDDPVIEDLVTKIEAGKHRLQSEIKDLLNLIQDHEVRKILTQSKHLDKGVPKRFVRVPDTDIADFEDAKEYFQQLLLEHEKLDQDERKQWTCPIATLDPNPTMVDLLNKYGFSQEELQDLLSKLSDFPVKLECKSGILFKTNVTCDIPSDVVGSLGNDVLFQQFFTSLSMISGQGPTGKKSVEDAVQKFWNKCRQEIGPETPKLDN